MSSPKLALEAEFDTETDTEIEAVAEPGDGPKYPEFTYLNAVVGKEIHNHYGKRVLEHATSKGDIVALKVGTRKTMDRSQAEMMHYAATHGIRAPKVRGIYDIVAHRPIARVMVSERVAAEPLVHVWKKMPKAEQTSIKEQLRVQISQMRSLTQPFIGRIGREPLRNIYDTAFTKYCGPFETEEEFDNWCLNRLYGGSFQRWKWQRALERKRRNSPGRFVLTHGDLSPRNIMVQGSTVMGIIDWEHSGFYPEYVEYAVAIGLHRGLEDWWIPVLKEILTPCLKDMVKFTGLIEERIGSFRVGE